MAPHIVGAEIIQNPIPSYGIKSCLGADDGSMLWSIPNLEHALTGITENSPRTGVQLSLDTVKQRLVYHSPYIILNSLILIDGQCIDSLTIRSQALLKVKGRSRQNTQQLARKSVLGSFKHNICLTMPMTLYPHATEAENGTGAANSNLSHQAR